MDLADAPEPAVTETVSLARILAFERRAWRTNGAKAHAIRDEFGMSDTRYHQVLNEIIDTRAALEADPVLVNLLRERRARLQQVRAGRL